MDDKGPCRIIDLSLETDYRPALNCSCGFTAIGDSWEETGAAMDEHLEGSAGDPQPHGKETK